LELQNRARLCRQFARMLGLLLALAVGRAPALAQQSAPVAGNHLNYVPFTAELPKNQQLRLAVIMALNHREQLAQLLAAMQERDSPSYHQWLTPQQFAARFGPTAGQMHAVAQWLGSRGFRISGIDQLKRTILFTGRYEKVKTELQTRIFGDESNYGNMTDPQVPAVLAPTIASIEGLYSSNRTPTHTDVYVASCTVPSNCNTVPHFGPSDFYTFYDETPVLQSGNLGTGANDCIALPEAGSFNQAAVNMFTSEFATALPASGTMPPITPSIAPEPDGGPTPGLPHDTEPSLDIEWAHAVSPNTPIRVYYTNGPNRYLGAMEQAANENLCGVISSSVEGVCDPVTTITALDDVEAQAAAQGQTIFKSSGDYGSQWYCGSPVPGALSNQQAYSQSNCSAQSANGYLDSDNNVFQPSIDEEAGSPNVTVVGGTQFAPSYSAAPAGDNLNNVEQGLETAWNGNTTPTPAPSSTPGCPTPTPTPSGGIEDCPVKDASGGGPSVIFPKPGWQAGMGVPDDGARDIPDVAMGANGTDEPGFFVAAQTAPCSAASAGPTFMVVGGTSIATPMWAGISRLIAQTQGVTRLGNINSRIYELGNLHSPASGLHDITVGNNNDNGIIGYNATPGFDLVTGWGSPDIAKLIAAFPGAAVTVVPVNITVPAGANAAAGRFTLSNTTSGPLYLNAVTVNVGSPTIFASLSMAVTIGTNPSQVRTVSPSASALFAFSPAVVIPSGDEASLTLEGLTAAQLALSRASLLAGWAITAGRGGSKSNQRNYLLWLACVGLVFIGFLVSASRSPTSKVVGIMILIGLTILAASCRGDSSGSPTPRPTAIATATPVLPSPTTTPTATPTNTPTASPSPSPTASSEQIIPQGAINVTDGNGGIIELTRLPATLGTVTIKY
jgi:subtilase family serine protease